MPLRNQPYLPLYVQDVISDEKLIECSAAATGVYFRLLCSLHKSDQYGCILLKQKYKQTPEQVKNFAYQLAKLFPWDLLVVESALKELIEEKVLHIEGDLLFQKRMVKDNDISEKRALAGKKGGDTTTKKNKTKPNNFAQPKPQANHENEYENEIENEDGDKGKGVGKPSREPETQEVYEALMVHFGIKEQTQFNLIRELDSFCMVLQSKNQIPYFVQQFKAYQEYKTKAQERPHNFKGFIGTIEKKYEDGGWCADNWVHKLEQHEKNKGSSNTGNGHQGVSNGNGGKNTNNPVRSADRKDFNP